MKVTCDTVGSFIENIQAEGSNSVYNKVIYLNRIEQPLGDTKRSAVRYLICLRFSTIIDVADGQYLLWMEEECGIDYCDSTDEKEGTETADFREEIVRQYCVKHGLKIRPGVVDF